MNKIQIVGLGPGSKKYVLPIVSEIIEASDLLVGSKRSLIHYSHKNCIYYENNLLELIKVIGIQRETQKITVVVTGDTGFYSLLDFLKQHFSDEDIHVTPGISSFQYMFSCLKKSYKDYRLLSFHGRQGSIVDALNADQKLFVLTDQKNTPQIIAQQLVQAGYGAAYMAVGENLSYEDETIIEGRVTDFIMKSFGNLCVVVVENEVDE
jgi:cobalt-precorrin-7 (C5)-methyltransferase